MFCGNHPNKFASITIHNSQRTKISHTLAELVERRTTVCAHAYHPRVVRRGSRGGEMGEFSPPFLRAPFFLFFFLIPQPGSASITLLQKFTPHFKILDPRLVVGSNLVYVRTLFSLFCGFVNSSSSTKLIKQWSLDRNKRFPELCFSRMSATVSGSELCMELICRRKSVLNAILLP